MSPLPSASPAVHAESGISPRAILTVRMISFTKTLPEPSQSPVQGLVMLTDPSVHVAGTRLPAGSVAAAPEQTSGKLLPTAASAAHPSHFPKTFFATPAWRT
jgi:hypothetical protein